MAQIFAFGCFLSTRVMHSVCPTARVVAPAVLPKHRLTFPIASADWQGGVASVEPCDETDVHGVMYDIAASELAGLDAYEGVDEGMYERVSRIVMLRNGGTIDAWLYIARTDGPAAIAVPRPSHCYIDTLVRGAMEHGLDAAWIEHLRNIK